MSLLFDNVFRDRGLHNFDHNLDEPRHRWYPFKEGFSKQLVTEAIAACPSRSISLKVLDPFAGSGTTPLAAALLGHDCVSIEVNPFCAFTTKVKCSAGTWRDANFKAIVDVVVMAGAQSSRRSCLETHSTFAKTKASAKWLFNRQVLRAFEGVSTAINAIGREYSPALRLAAIRAAMACCNATKDGKCLRYRKAWQEIGFSREDFFEAFKYATTIMLDDTNSAPIDARRKVRVQQGDARRLLTRHAPRSFDCVIMSPPYLNSFDYSDVYRPELFLGNFVSDNAALRRIRLRTIRSHVQVKWAGETAIENPLVKNAVDAIRNRGNLWNKRLPLMVEAYFHDMRGIMAQCFRLLKKGSQAWLVVSTSAYAGIHIPVDLILADIATREGFRLDSVNVLRSLRAAGQQQSSFAVRTQPLRESLIVLQK